MTDKEKIRAIIQQYAKKGEILLEESYAEGEHASTVGYWDGYTDCAKLLLKEIDSLQEEPVSIDFEQELYKAFGQVKDFTLGMRIAKWFYYMGKNSQEPVSEDFEKEMDNYLPTVFSKDMDSGEPRFTTWFRALRKTARHFTEWKKQQMMEDAVDATVHIDSGNYPYIPQIELYDYEKDVPLAKEGDKYKVVLIKED